MGLAEIQQTIVDSESKSSADQVIASGPWEFNAEVTQVFDDMISRSIPGYGELRKLINQISSNSIKADSVVSDLGCSTGLAIENLRHKLPLSTEFYGFDIAEEMVAASKSKFAEFSNVKIKKLDLEEPFELPMSDLILSIFTIQFLKLNCKKSVMENIFKSLKPGGDFILAEKN